MSKTKNTSQNKETARIRPIEEMLREQQQILNLTEQRSLDRFSDKNLDRENEIIELLSGEKVTLKEVRKKTSLLADLRQPHKTAFIVDFYREIYRLNNWPDKNPSSFNKPPVVSKYTVEIIYHRFPTEILVSLRKLNLRDDDGHWLYKHHQFLSLDGREQLEQFIKDAVRLMISCTTWHEFRVKHHKEYGSSYQLSLFENNDALSTRPNQR